MRSSVLIRKSLGIAALFGIAAVAGMPSPASATILTGFTLAPTWAFGVPQRPFITGCSDPDPGGACFGHFGLGPLSDILDYRNVGQSTFVEISFADSAGPPPAAFVFGRRETAYEAPHAPSSPDYWNLIIPTARWLGLGPNQGIRYRLRDPGDPAGVFGDAIAYVNINNSAHILYASNNSDTPDPTVPDFTADFPATSFFDVFVELSPDGGFNQSTLDGSGTPTPMAMQCDPATDNQCIADDPTQTLPTVTVPEPSSLALIAGALGALAGIRRRRQRG